MFVGLHRHSHYSKRDGIAKVPDIVKRVGELGQCAWALTDHGTTSGLMEAYKETMKYNKENGTNIKFIFGCEMYWVPNYFIKDRKASCHLLVLAKNQVGYENLLKLVTIGYGDRGRSPDNYFYTMRVTTELLEKYKEGLIITSACMGGPLNPETDPVESILSNDISESNTNTLVWDKNLAYERVERFKAIFGDSFYLEIQTGTDERQKGYNERILEMSKEFDLPVIVTEDSHYVLKSEAGIHRKWLGIDDDSDYYQTDDFFIHSEEEVKEALADTFDADTIQQAINETARIAELCEQVKIEFGGKHFPVIELEGTPFENVCKIVARGWKDKIVGRVPEAEWPKYKAQIDHELHVLEKCDYLTYFLMTEDFLRWARSQDIRMGIGRGSVGGSLISYLMDITRIDPIKYGLIFERFAHDKRVSLPDVDNDVMNARRGDVIKYLVDKYIEVYHVRTFGMMGEKAAIQRSAKALGYVPEQVRALSKGVSCIGELEDETLKKLAYKYVGILEHYGTHASAIMLFPAEPTKWCAIEKQGNDYVCAYEYPDLEAQGLLKLDILGIKTLDAIDGCMKMIDNPPDLDNLPDDDPETFDMLNKLDVLGCFQIESGGMMNIIKNIKPRSIFDLVPLVALYRPSTIQSGMVQEFIDRRTGKDFEYLHPGLENSLKDTYGVLLYQEQAMKIVQDMAGYDLGKADMFRRAIGHKVPAEMAVLIPQFEEDGAKKGIDKETMAKLAEWLTNCAAYQFNKSHSAAYGYTCYQTAYLKAHHPAEYLCSYLNAYKDSKQEDLLPYIEDAQKHGVRILPPDASKNHLGWTVEQSDGHTCLRMAVNFVRSVGTIALPLDKESFSKLNKSKAENLIKAGAMDFLGIPRGQLLNELYSSGKLTKVQNSITVAQNRADSWKVKLSEAKEGTKKYTEALQKVNKYTLEVHNLSTELKNITSSLSGQIYDNEKGEYEVLGMTFRDPFDGIDLSKFEEPDMEKDSKKMVISVGIVTALRPWKQKNGKPMLFFSLKCPSGKVYDLVMFNYNLTKLEQNRVYKMTLFGNKFKRLL